MKISEIKGDRVFEVIADVIDPIANIAGDKEITELLSKKKLPEGSDPRAFALERLKKSAPKLLKSHKGDIIAILAALEGVSCEKYKKGLSMLKLMKDFTELLNDPDFKALFFSAQSGSGSGSASESTEAPAH